MISRQEKALNNLQSLERDIINEMKSFGTAVKELAVCQNWTSGTEKSHETYGNLKEDTVCHDRDGRHTIDVDRPSSGAWSSFNDTSSTTRERKLTKRKKKIDWVKRKISLRKIRILSDLTIKTTHLPLRKWPNHTQKAPKMEAHENQRCWDFLCNNYCKTYLNKNLQKSPRECILFIAT